MISEKGEGKADEVGLVRILLDVFPSLWVVNSCQHHTSFCSDASILTVYMMIPIETGYLYR